jgi:hypothetical protein
MRLRRQATKTVQPSPGAVEQVGQLVLCGECGSSNTAADSFCSNCGKPLPPPKEGAATLVSVPAAAPSVDEPAELTPVMGLQPTPRSSRPLYSVSLGLVAAAIGLAVLAFLWHSASVHATHVQHRLTASQRELVVTKARLAATAAQLDSTTALARRRRAVLVQAQKVLTKVDPLLSSVDGIQGQSTTVQGDGDALASDANNLVSALVAAANYLYYTSPTDFDPTTWSGLVGTVNGYFDSFKADETLFASAKSGYGSASTKFGNQADAFSSAVRRLQRELKSAVGK